MALADRVQDDHRDLPGGVPLVVGEARVLLLVRDPDLLPLVAIGHPRGELPGRAPDLCADPGLATRL